jgi:hypothetical protein
MIGFGTFTVIEQLSVCLWFGTLCVNAKINHLTIAVGIDVPEKDFKRAPPLFSIHCVFLLIASLMYAFLRHRKQKLKRKIVPTSIETPNVNITNRSTQLSQKSPSIFTDFASSMTISASLPMATQKLYLVQEATFSYNKHRDPETDIHFDESIIINPNNLRLDENSENLHHLMQFSAEMNIFKDNYSDKVKSEVDNVKISFSICACIIIATLCIFFATSKLSFVANLLHILIALAIHLSSISFALLSDEILDYMIRKFSNLIKCPEFLMDLLPH